MDFFFGDHTHDLDGIFLEECTATLSKRTFFTCFELRPSIVRNGNRDIAPPGVEKSLSEMLGLTATLGNEFPGAIVPPFSEDNVNLFLKRIMAHPELGRSETLLAFVLGGTPKNRGLPGDGYYFSTGSPPAEEVESVLKWAKEKDRLLDLARRKATKSAQSLEVAATDAAALLTAGGVLLPEAPSHDCGISDLLLALDDETKYVDSLRKAAIVVRNLHDRLASSRASLEATSKSYEEQKSALSSSKRDVEIAQVKYQRVQNATDEALNRFTNEAKAFIRDFPQRWSTYIDDLVDAQIRTASSLSSCLLAARKDVVVSAAATAVQQITTASSAPPLDDDWVLNNESTTPSRPTKKNDSLPEWYAEEEEIRKT